MSEALSAHHVTRARWYPSAMNEGEQGHRETTTPPATHKLQGGDD
jgi:hypothetical protein